MSQGPTERGREGTGVGGAETRRNGVRCGNPARAGWRGGALLAALVGGTLVVSGRPAMAAETRVLKAAADAGLFFAAPGSNLGGSDSVAVGSTGHDQPGRGLFRFDLAGAVPAGMRPVAARLAFSVVRAPGGGVASRFAVHRMQVPWEEGRGAGNLGQPALDGEVTWDRRRHPSGAWAGAGGQPGVDYRADASGSATVDLPGRYEITGPGLVEDVKAWLADPASNAGWMMVSDLESRTLTARRVGTRENADPLVVATLTLDLEPEGGGGGTVAPVLTRWGRSGDRFELEFRGEPGNVYQVQYLDLTPAGGAAGWQVLTNIVVKLAPAFPVVSEALSVSPARCYRVADVGDVD